MYFLFVLSICTFGLRAQEFPSEYWHDGKIVLEGGDTLRGLIKYDLDRDLIQYNIPDRKTEAYTARKVIHFEIFDTTTKRYRQFYTLPYVMTGTYKTPIFFELLEEGKLTLLARETIEYRTMGSPYFYGSYSRAVLVFKYYFLNEDGAIQPFTGTKNDLFQMMGNRSKDVEDFIRANRLKFEDKEDFSRIIEFYNSLFGT